MSVALSTYATLWMRLRAGPSTFPRNLAGILCSASRISAPQSSGNRCDTPHPSRPSGLPSASVSLCSTSGVCAFGPASSSVSSFVNGQLVLSNRLLPIQSVAGQQLGNLVEVVAGAWLLRRLVGRRAKLDQVQQVVGLIGAVAIATGITASAGAVSMLAGDVINLAATPRFLQTWWLGDTTGALVVLPLLLIWLADFRAAWRCMRTIEGGLLVATVVVVATLAVTSNEFVTYLIFPALIWAAFRFGPAGATIATAITAGLTIGITAERVGAFAKQPIDDRTLATQLYLLTGALTALLLSAIVSERERSSAELVEVRRREGERALEERRRIARDLHDSVSQSLFSTNLPARTAEKALRHDPRVSRAVKASLRTIGELTKRAQQEMRRFIFEWDRRGSATGSFRLCCGMPPP
jgi:integral membrane sensor domain MASE1